MLTWNEIVQYFVKHFGRIGKATRPLHDHFGILYFTYHRIDHTGKYTVLVDRPDWAEHYVSSQIYLNDPYLRHPSNYKSGLCLIDSHGTREYQENLMKSAKNVLNADLGVVLIEKGSQHAEFFGFAANKEQSALQNLFLNHSSLLKSFAAHFKKEMGSLLNQMDEEAGSLSILKGADYHASAPVAPDVAREAKLAYYRDLGLLGAAEKLSKRERQLLKLLVEDKSAKETAAALGLKPRTVEFYFENIKDKLSCWSKQELLKIARKWDELGIL